MAFGVLKKIVGDPNERALKELRPTVDEVNALEPEIEALGDEQLRAKTEEFRSRLEEGEPLDDLLPEALAVAREAIRRTVGERAYDVQLSGAIVLHRGGIAEMRTGEGKTLVATLALYVNALEGEGAHLVTVNDYLAAREPQWYGPALDMLGMTLGVIRNDGAFVYSAEPVSEQPSMEHLLPVPRREAYDADITYGTNNEFGFDYLRDNMVQTAAQRGQRPRHFAIVDEADSVLIDEGADAADHLRPAAGQPLDLPALQRARPAASARRPLHHRGAHALGAPDRGRDRGPRTGTQRRQHLLAGELPANALHGGRAQGADHLPARPWTTWSRTARSSSSTSSRAA